MRHIFLDETGDFGFGKGTKYLIIAAISPESGKALNKKFKNFNAHLISNGWNKDVEIKAFHLWTSPTNADIPANYKYKSSPKQSIEFALSEIAAVDCHIEYIAVKLDGVPDAYQKMGTSELYKMYSWDLLKGLLCNHSKVHLCVDRRDRHRDSQMKFDGFLEGKVAAERAQRAMPPIELRISHLHSKAADGLKADARAEVEFFVRGLQAADFVCWAIKRQFENGDHSWAKKIEPRIKARYHIHF